MLRVGAAIVLAVALGSWVARHAAQALTTGVARAARGARFERTEQPGWFWSTVVGQLAITFGCAYLIAYLIHGII
jgi:hypothetical protein